jgi:hypothetical protein
MTEAQAVEAILQHWKTAWEAAQPTIPWTTTNEVYRSEAAWVRIAVVPTVSNQASMGPSGSRRWARRGQIAVQVFTAVNNGDAARAGLADTVRTCLEGARISTAGVDEPVCTYAGSTGEQSTDGAWNMCVVTVPFRYDQHR